MAPTLRPDLAELGGYHSPQVAVDVRLNTNESPYPPPDAFVAELADAVRDVAFHRYPDRDARALRSAIGEYVGVGLESVFAANGSNEVLETLLVAFGGPQRRALLWTPTYSMHAQIADMCSTPYVARPRDEDFTVGPDEVRAAIAETCPDIVFFCSPNNPTGTVELPDAVEAALTSAPDALVVVDEAYAEFGDRSWISKVAGFPNLVVCRTMSKAWAMPALRLGYAVASPDLIEALGPAHLPYHLDAVSQVAGVIALRYRDDLSERVAAIASERDRVLAALAAMPGVVVWPSGANFFLFRPPGDAHQVWERLLAESVLVRDFSARADTQNCLRVTVGTPAENDRFLAALGAALAAASGGLDSAASDSNE